MKFIDDFEAFLRQEVNLNQTRFDRLQQSIDAIEGVLSGHDIFGKIFLDLIPTGSWAHRTIIRPVRENDEFDADVLLYVKECTDWQPKDYLEELWSAFHNHDVYKPLAQRKTRCVRINYAGDFHIDVVPYLERAGSHYVTNRCEPEGVGRFELSDPEAFTAWIDERQRLTNGHFIKTIRLVKYLRDFKNTFDCKSIILMTLLGNQVDPVEAGLSPALYANVPSTLVILLGKLASALPATMPAILDPAGTGDTFSERYKESWNYTNFRTHIINYANRMRAAYEEENRDVSIAKWQDVFGDEFKPGALARKALSEPFVASVPWAGEKFIDQRPYNFPMRIDPNFRARITGRVTGLATGQETRRNGFRQFVLAKQGNRVPKNRRLQFTVTTNVPKPHHVYWKVRNGGVEANYAQQLRGEISEDQGSKQKTETTLYTGHHYVECYIVKGGAVVARDRQDVIVLKNR
ncbi:MAG: SMODS domain-containing nucleotidyltransferase [Ktedonobacteraceae bacterium]